MAEQQPPDLSESIAQSAREPLKATGDSGSMEQHPLPDQIAADRYLRSRRAAGRGLGIRQVRMIPPAP